jgi:hypothetical protein
VRSGAEVTVTRGNLLKRIGNKIVHATVDDFSRRLPAHGRHPAAGRAEISLDLIDWVSPTKAVYMSEAAKAIDFYHNGGMFTQRCESYGEAGDRHGAAG